MTFVKILTLLQLGQGPASYCLWAKSGLLHILNKVLLEHRHYRGLRAMSLTYLLSGALQIKVVAPIVGPLTLPQALSSSLDPAVL